MHALSAWSEKWLLGFNAGKCNILHLGKNNKQQDYFMKNGDNTVKLNKSEFEKELGVYVDKHLDFKVHISTLAKKVRSAAGIIFRHIINKTPNIMVPLNHTHKHTQTNTHTQTQ